MLVLGLSFFPLVFLIGNDRKQAMEMGSPLNSSGRQLGAGSKSPLNCMKQVGEFQHQLLSHTLSCSANDCRLAPGKP